MQPKRFLIPKELFQLFARGRFTRIVFILRNKVPFHKIKIFAEISRVLFLHGIGAAIATLMRGSRIVTGAIQADPQINVASVT
ncbi:MAG: hypothetical protein ABIP71_01360 [Verrucomicrobiota bacterium]